MKTESAGSLSWVYLFSKLFAVAAVVWGFAHWRSMQVPVRMSSMENMQKEPLQTTTAVKPFAIAANGHNYQINPIYEYEMWGLVVSDHHSDSWIDSDHEAWNDYINTKDICVIWGGNITNPYLSKLSFRNGNWTCYVETKSSEAWQNFKMEQLSNNHLIPANGEIQKLIANSSVGDEIRIKGHLVNYSVNQGTPRKSSIVRTDRENGACEIVYVNEFQTFARHNQFWNVTKKISKSLSAFFAIAILFSIFALPFLFKDNHA